MAVTLNASTSTGLVQSADTSGNIELQNNGTTRLTVGSSGVTIPTLNTATGVLATQNGMTGIAKAWVNFDGATPTITSSFNVGSITKNGSGDYTVNFTTAMPDANYSVSGSTGNQGSPSGVAQPFLLLLDNSTAPTTSAVRVATVQCTTAGVVTTQRNFVQIFST